jgi:ABC transporter related protein
MDAVIRRRFWDELLDLYLRERPTIVISSHQVDEIEDLLEDVIVLHRGHLVASGSADDLRAAHSRPGQGLASLTDTFIDITERDFS